jgi:nitrate/TMAO reductase-like tetraheme cytochrome c subunit
MNQSPATPLKRALNFKNWISLAGLIVAAGSIFSFAFLWAMSLMSDGGNQYLGILTWIVAPMFLICGLILIFVGWFLNRRRVAKMAPDGSFPLLTIDLSRPRDRRNLMVFMIGGGVFLLMSAFGSYQTYHYSESVEFCGTLCHSVMSPEFEAYKRGEHARVSCVACHVGGGPDFYVMAKLNGARQLYSLAFDKFNRPIPTPIHGLRPAQDTCEQCHWPERFTGNLERRYDHVLSDDDNTPYSIRLLLKVGGGGYDQGPVEGIHWHMSKDNKVEYYATDDKRQDIAWVKVTLEDGTVRVYRKGDYSDSPDPKSVRVMDCVDCHTRPAHNFRAPNDLVENSLRLGRISPELPAIKRVAVEALSAEYKTTDEAMEGIDRHLRTTYEGHPDVRKTAAELQSLYKGNFFPEMLVNWRAYPNNVGHKDWNGCFRCHNDELLFGKQTLTITQNDCNSCHTILAQGRDEQLTMLAPEGLEFIHPEGDTLGLLCADCHNGGNQGL